MADEEDQPVTPVAPPPQAAIPRGSGFTYSTPGPGNWQNPQTVAGPANVPVQIPQNAQNFTSIVGPPPEDQETAAFRKMFNSLPMDQAIKAYQSAMQFQASRMAQNKLKADLAAGVPYEKAWTESMMTGAAHGLFSTPKEMLDVNKSLTDAAAAKFKNQMPVSPLGKLQSDRQAAMVRGDSEAVKQYDAAIQESVSNKGKSIYMGQDDQGRPIFQMSEGGAPLPTVAMQTQAQEKEVKYANAVELMSNLEGVLKPEHLGLRGAVGEHIVDKGLQQITEAMGMPDVASGGRMEARKLIVGLRESMMREMNNDNRFTKDDRAEIASALPSNGVFESYADAKKGIDVVRRIVQQRSRNYASAIGKPPPLWSLSSDEIVKLYKEGKIKRQDAENALTRYH